MNNGHRVFLENKLRPRWIKNIPNEWYAIDLGLIVVILVVAGLYVDRREDIHASHVTRMTARAIEVLVW